MKNAVTGEVQDCMCGYGLEALEKLLRGRVCQAIKRRVLRQRSKLVKGHVSERKGIIFLSRTSSHTKFLELRI